MATEANDSIIPMPTHLTAKGILAMANHKEAPYIKRRRIVSAHRVIFSVRSDFLYHYTDNWFRNRNADIDRVRDIMKSIETEGECDNRIYVADILDCPIRGRLLTYDGNHRREALNRLYMMKNKTIWVDLDVLLDVPDTMVIDAFRRVNQGICLPESYIEYESDDETHTPDSTNKIAFVEQWIVNLRERWPNVIVDKNRTRIPYCTKNDLANFLMDYLQAGGQDHELRIRLEMLNEELRLSIENKSPHIQNSARALGCYLFSDGIQRVRRALLPQK